MKTSAAPRHSCPVCGYPDLQEAPRSRSGGGSYEICPCCGFQFGVDDDDRGVTPEKHRAQWIQGGMVWFSRSIPPPRGWDPRSQLRRLDLEAH